MKRYLFIFSLLGLIVILSGCLNNQASEQLKSQNYATSQQPVNCGTVTGIYNDSKHDFANSDENKGGFTCLAEKFMNNCQPIKLSVRNVYTKNFAIVDKEIELFTSDFDVVNITGNEKEGCLVTVSDIKTKLEYSCRFAPDSFIQQQKQFYKDIKTNYGCLLVSEIISAAEQTGSGEANLCSGPYIDQVRREVQAHK